MDPERDQLELYRGELDIVDTNANHGADAPRIEEPVREAQALDRNHLRHTQVTRGRSPYGDAIGDEEHHVRRDGPDDKATEIVTIHVVDVSLEGLHEEDKGQTKQS